MLPSFSLVGSYHRCMYWSSIEKPCRSGMACISVIRPCYCIWIFADFLCDWLRRLMCICYSTDSPSFECVNWLGILCTITWSGWWCFSWKWILLPLRSCCMLHQYLLALNISCPVVIFICIFDRSVTSLPSIIDLHHWLRPCDTEVARSLISTVIFALKDEAICSGLMSIQYISILSQSIWLDCILGKLYISL